MRVRHALKTIPTNLIIPLFTESYLLMKHIIIISSSVREDRKSHRLALFFKRYIEEGAKALVEIVDLKEYRFPLFEERLKFQKNPSDRTLEFSEKIKNADGVLIVTPEYNGGYPASLKNVIDLLYDEWFRKPIAIATVSDGVFGGMQVITSLQFTLWKMKAWVIPAMFPTAKVSDNYDEEGYPKNRDQANKLAEVFINELFRYIDAKAMIA